MNDKIQLGSIVRDRITGFVGVATGRAEYLHSTPTVQVKPQQLQDGNFRSPVWIDESQLEVMERETLKQWFGDSAKVEP